MLSHVFSLFQRRIFVTPVRSTLNGPNDFIAFFSYFSKVYSQGFGRKYVGVCFNFNSEFDCRRRVLFSSDVSLSQKRGFKLLFLNFHCFTTMRLHLLLFNNFKQIFDVYVYY